MGSDNFAIRKSNPDMLSKKKQKKYAEKRWKSVQRHFKIFCYSNHPEELHRMRLGIKKIKALLEIYPQAKKITNHFKPVKKIFKHAALIRDAHINLQYIEKYKIPDVDFGNKETERLVKQTREFLSHQKDYLKILKETQKNMAKDFIDIENKSIEHLYMRQFRKLAALFIGRVSPAELHSCRKKIKVLIHLYDILNRSLVTKLRLNVPYLDKLQDSIGEWHDAAATLKFLEAKAHSDKEAINKLRKQIQRKLRAVGSLTNRFEEKVRKKRSNSKQKQ
jgi:CHAD domain-containing protein